MKDKRILYSFIKISYFCAKYPSFALPPKSKNKGYVCGAKNKPKLFVIGQIIFKD